MLKIVKYGIFIISLGVKMKIMIQQNNKIKILLNGKIAMMLMNGTFHSFVER